MGSTRAAAAFGLVAMLLAPPVPATAVGVAGRAAGHGTPPAGVVINEFAPSGRGSTDEFLELHNTSDQVAWLDGWELWGCLSHNFPVLVAVFGEGTVIGPDGHLLIAHMSSTGLPADFAYGWDVPDDGGWLLSDPWSGQFDGVGLRPSADCTEGDRAPQCDWAVGDAVARDADGRDTDNNAADFTCQVRTPGW